MTERRAELRLATSKEVSVVVVHGDVITLGKLCDVSMDGARIELSLSLEPMQKIDLIFDDNEQSFRCTVRWSQNNEIGVSFDRPLSLVSVPAS